jgi:hypothetical protein
MNQAEIQKYKSGKSAEQIKVIDYFTKQGCCAAFGVMKDEDYRALVRRRRDALKLSTADMALDKLGVDESQVAEIPPVRLEGYLVPRAFAKKTATGAWVTSRYEVTWIFFGSHQLYLYSLSFNMDEDKKNENTQEFFYKDVTALKTETKTYSSDGDASERMKATGDEKVELEKLVFVITVPGEKLVVAMDEDEVPDRERIVQAMKHKLREKKSS